MEPQSIFLLVSLLLKTAFISAHNNVNYVQPVSFEAEGRSQDNGFDYEEDSISDQYASSTIDINEFLIGVIENFKEDMTTGIPELKVPVLDPFKHKKPVKVDVDDSKASLRGNFTDIHVEGMSGFVLEHMSANLNNLSLKFWLRLPYIKGLGNYTIDGKVIKIIPVRGNGSFSVESYNLTLAAKASIINADNDRLQLSDDFDVFIDFQKVDLYLENFLGGGKWTEVLLKILSDISKDLFRKVIPQLKGELNKSLLKVINKHLSKLPITSIIPSSTADEYVDQILTNVQNFIREKNLDPMPLPDYGTNFTKEVAFVTFNGEAKLHNGWLSGISTLYRADECQLSTNRTHISVAAHLGLNDLILSYKGRAKFMSLGPSLIVGGSVKKIRFYFEIEQSNKKGAKPHLREFEITELSTIWIELSGLGPLTWVMKWLLTGISKLIENFIAEKLTFYIQEYVGNEFEKISFPV